MVLQRQASLYLLLYKDKQFDFIQNDAQFDYYARRVAACSTDGIIQIFEVDSDENDKLIPVASFKA